MYNIPEDLTIPDFLRRGVLPKLPPLARPALPGTGFSLVGKPYGSGFTMPRAPLSGNLPVPFSGGGVPAQFGAGGGLPATQGFAPPAPQGGLPATRSFGGDLQSLLKYIPAPLLSILSGAGRGSAFGPIGAGLGTVASVMAPKPAGDANDNGTGTLLTQPTFPNGVPLPQSRPVNYGPEFNEAFGSVPTARPAFDPMKQANPYQRASDVGSLVAGNPYASAPQAPNFGFGAGDPGQAGYGNMSPSNMGQGSTGSGSDMLRALLASLQGR